MNDVDFEKLMTMIVELKPNEMHLLTAFVAGIIVKNYPLARYCLFLYE